MMKATTMRERMLALLQGQELDRIPFATLDYVAPLDHVLNLLGPDRIGLLHWCPMHRIEHPNCPL